MNAPTTTLTALSDICEEFGQAAAAADDTWSLPRMQVGAFRAWLERADPGASLEYHRGFLICDRGPESDLPEDRRSALARVADAALNAAERGRVHLVQRRISAFDFSYPRNQGGPTSEWARRARAPRPFLRAHVPGSPPRLVLRCHAGSSREYDTRSGE
jgi:hypothetical protein